MGVGFGLQQLTEALVQSLYMVGCVVPSCWSRLVRNQTAKQLTVIQLPYCLSST
jgi:hypothetical protein